MKPDEVRVMQVVTRLVGGSARQAFLLATGLPERFRNRLVTGPERDGTDWTAPEGLVSTLPALKRAPDPTVDVRALMAMISEIRKFRPHVIHSHMSKGGALARIAAKLTRVPVVVHTFHGHVLEGYFGASSSAAYRRIERFLARRTDALTAVSPAVRDQLIQLGVGRPQQWHLTPIGVLDESPPVVPSGEVARKQLGLPADGPIVGIVGRLTAIKDLPAFFESAARIRAKRSDVTFVVAGDGELRASLEARAAALLDGSVRFLGWVSDLPALYAAVDAVVLTSRNEGTPRSLIEAADAGKPVVATAVGGVSEVVKDGLTGYLVPPGDPEATADRTLELLEDPERARSMGRAGHDWVGGRFSIGAFIERVGQLYDRLLARRARGASRRPGRPRG